MDDWREIPISQNEENNIMIRIKLSYYQSVKQEEEHNDKDQAHLLPISQNEKKNIMIRSRLNYFPFVFFLAQKWLISINRKAIGCRVLLKEQELKRKKHIPLSISLSHSLTLAISMASPNSVKILDICEVAAAYDHTKSATEKILSPTFFELSGLRFPPSECLWFFKLTDSNPTFFHSVIFPSLKQSLSHALLHFLPIVGGLTWPPESSRPFFVYHLNKDSVTVTLAECNGDFDRLIGNGIHEAVESHPYAPHFVATETRSPLLALQVTFFPNKGFCIGMATHHAIFDGKSTSMFLRAWAYTSKYIVEKGEAPRLLPEEITPSFEWKSIQDSKGLEEAYINLWATIGKRLESGSDSNPRSVKPLPKLEVQPDLLRANFHLSSEVIKKLRESVLRFHPEATGPTKRLNLSTYVLACSYVSICLVKARGGDADRELQKKIVTVQRRLQLASTPVTPRPITTDSTTEDRSLRHRQTPNRLQRRLHRTTADLRFQQHKSESQTTPDTTNHQTPPPTTPITASIDSDLQQQRQRLSRCCPLKRQRPPTVPSSRPALSDRQSSRINRRRPRSATDCSGPRLRQSRVRRQQQHPRRRRRRKQQLARQIN
ncbi:hypothetical protein NC651_003952 [Populus alba x Populus x berolinensis]|nr:hypothetical protein NC651_003952 [Populus alba x Populus x berolinensis]